MAKVKIWAECEAGEEVLVELMGVPNAGEVAEPCILRGTDNKQVEVPLGITLCVTRRRAQKPAVAGEWKEPPVLQDDEGAPDVIAWLIEYKTIKSEHNPGAPVMWARLKDHKVEWTEDPDEALQFNRKMDAVKFMDAFDHAIPAAALAVEHFWSDVPRETSNESDSQG